MVQILRHSYTDTVWGHMKSLSVVA